MLSKAFTAERKRFETMDDARLFKVARAALLDFDRGTNKANDDAVGLFYKCVAASLKLGFGRDELSDKQTRFAKDLYALIGESDGRPDRSGDVFLPAVEDDRRTIGLYNRFGVLPVGRDMLYLLLCAANIDGFLSDELAVELSPVFKELFRHYSEKTGLDELPVSTNNVCGLDALIVDLFFKKGEWMSFAEIKLSFPDEPIEEVRNALKWLTIRGVLIDYYNVIGEPYGLAVSRNKVRLDLSYASRKNGEYLDRLNNRSGESPEKLRIAEVSFAPGGKRYDYLYDIPLQVGDRCVVEANGEEKIVTVENLTEKEESQLAVPLLICKMILRKAEE